MGNGNRSMSQSCTPDGAIRCTLGGQKKHVFLNYCFQTLKLRAASCQRTKHFEFALPALFWTPNPPSPTGCHCKIPHIQLCDTPDSSTNQNKSRTKCLSSRRQTNMCLFLVHSKRARFHPIPQSIHLTAEARNGIGRSSANKCLKFVRIPQENGTTIRWNCETVSLLHYLVTLLSQAGFLPHANKTAVLTNEPNHHSIYSCLLGKGLLFGNIIISQKWWSCTSTAQRSKLHHGDAAGIRSIFR